MKRMIKGLRWLIQGLVGVALLVLPWVAQAQAPTILSVDFNKAKFDWAWSQGNGGAVGRPAIISRKGTSQH